MLISYTLGLKSTPVKLLSSVSKPLYPSISLLCFQESSDAIFEWQYSLQYWLRLTKLILVPGVKGERKKSSTEPKGLSGAWGWSSVVLVDTPRFTFRTLICALAQQMFTQILR